jgi:hypothetical protein
MRRDNDLLRDEPSQIPLYIFIAVVIAFYIGGAEWIKY